MTISKKFVSLVRELYKTNDFIPLHEPRFVGKEKEYVANTIESTFVSSVGKYVDEFESKVAKFIGVKYAVATVNGTSALHAALVALDVMPGDLVITQSLTFVATCNAIKYCGAEPVFVDVDKSTFGMSAQSLDDFLSSQTVIKDGRCIHSESERRVKVCIPMHTFGHPVDIDAIKKICDKYGIHLLEDSAESLGSTYSEKGAGSFGELSIISFNGNKIITTGGGGMVVTNNEELAVKVKHLTTTAKIAHKWNYNHNEVGYNYRMPNLNAALGCAQLENLNKFINNKRNLAQVYSSWCLDNDVNFFNDTKLTKSNYWLNALILKDEKERTDFLEETNSNDIMTRPSWEPMHRLDMYKDCYSSNLENTNWLSERIVNIPSSVISQNL